MLNIAAISTALAGLVGWHDATAYPLPAPLKVSRSGLFVNDLNELLTLPVLADCVPPGEALGPWMQRLTTDALTRLAGRLAAAQNLSGKVLLLDAPLLKGPGRAADTINKLGRFVGLRVSLARKKGVTYTVPRLSIQLDTVQATPLNIYVYTDTQPDPVQVIALPAGFNRANYPYRYELEDANALDLTFAVQPEQWAYIGYYEDDLTGRAIQVDGAGYPCGCSADPYTTYSPFVTVRGIAVGGAYEADREAFLADNATEESSNFGLDLSFTAYCDTSQVLMKLENQLQVQEVVQMALGLRFIEAILNTPNLTQTTQRQALQADAMGAKLHYMARLYGGKDSGTDTVYESLLGAVVLDLSGLDAACLPQREALVSMGTMKRG